MRRVTLEPCAVLIQKNISIYLLREQVRMLTLRYQPHHGVDKAGHRGGSLFRDEEITGLKPEAVARLGVTRTFQVTRLFKEMTVLENIMAGFHMHARASFPAVMAGLRKARREESSLKEKAMDLLEATGLKDEAQTVAGSMPYGLQRIVEMARALAGKPALLMLDEPAAGLNDRETATLVDFIRTIEGQGVTVLLVEHDVKMVMTVSRHVVVLNHGEKLAEGPPAEIRRHPEVVKAYLGKEY